LIVILGFLQAWAGRFFIEPDGVNYFDVACAYERHDWSHAINGYWSPLYSWLLALIDITFRPTPYWQTTFLHFLNLFVFVLALIAFEFFLARLLTLVNSLFPELNDPVARPEWAWWLLGYTAFAVCTLRVITLSNDTPDMVLAALVFVATGCLIDLRQFDRGAVRYALLGAVLGVAYLTKGVMFPLFFVFLVSTVFARGGWKKPDLGALATVAGFLVVSAPFVAALSHAKGHLTFGETGKVAYIHEVLHGYEYSVDSVNRLTSGDGKTEDDETQRLPQLVSEVPEAYFYATPYALATYPAWYDPSYWWNGRSPRFSLREQIRAVGRAAASFFHMLSTEKQWVAGWLVLGFLGGSWRRTRERLATLWSVWLPPLATLSLYSLVLVEPRYAAVWVTILWVVLFAAVEWPRMEGALRLGPAVVLAISITSGIAVIKGGFDSLAECMRSEQNVQFEIGKSLLNMGLTPGDQLAFVGHTTVADHWAQLSHLRVAGDVPAEAMYSYWTVTPEKRNEIAERFRAHGIKALILSGPPLIPAKWQAVGSTGYYVQFLDGNGVGSASAPTSESNSR
jgi:4-amino-4-deoxy-L-arabinose transferase-like glycosyltransferase